MIEKVKEFTFPTKSIGIKKEGTAETNPKSRYSNSVKLCQLPKLTFYTKHNR